MMSLEVSFTKNFIRYDRIMRDGNVCIYSLRYLDNLERIVGYDVFEVQPAGSYEIKGMMIEADESMPGKNSYGSKAWSYCSLEAAQKKFDSLLK